MTNTVRTPRQGKTANSRRIAEAVDNEDWQKFRLSLKGRSTREKLDALYRYFYSVPHGGMLYRGSAVQEHLDNNDDCDECIRVDNYLKALCRGGQLYAGESLQTALNSDWNLRIKK